MCIICDWGSLSFPLNLNILTRNITYMNTKLTVAKIVSILTNLLQQHYFQKEKKLDFCFDLLQFGFHSCLRRLEAIPTFCIHRPNRNPH